MRLHQYDLYIGDGILEIHFLQQTICTLMQKLIPEGVFQNILGWGNGLAPNTEQSFTAINIDYF